MRHRKTLYAFVLMVVALRAFAADRVFLVYDEQQISDADRAMLMRIEALAVSSTAWRTYTVPEDWQLATLIDKAYDYFLKDQNGKPAYPNTMDAIARLIIQHNRQKFVTLPDPARKNVFEAGIKRGTVLQIPHLPVRAEWLNEDHPVMRVFRPDTNAYATVKDAADPARALLPVATDVNNSDATVNHPYRKVRFTAFEVPNWSTIEAAIEAAAEFDETLQIPQSVIVRTDSPTLTLTLLDGADDCPQSPSRLTASPHLAMASPTLDEYRNRVKSMLDAGQDIRPLWIVDWDVSSPTGHGAKVASVVNAVLDDLGFDPRLKKFVPKFDLNPRNNGAELRATLDAYEDSCKGADTNFATSILPRAFITARKWIEHPPVDQANALSDLDHDINEFVVQAVLWRFLNQEEAFVNMSFTINYPAGQPLNARFMEGAQSFATVAAGNGDDQHPYVLPGAYPQMGANTYPNLINVTYGTTDGRPLGSRTSPEAFVIVDLVAPGCGFEHDGIIHKEDRGSSFASPYVAVTAWLKAICEGIAPKEMKALLQNANRLSPYKDIASHGVYDPALLYMSQMQTPHLIDKDGTLFILACARIDMEYSRFDAGATPQHLPITFGDHLTGGHLAVVPCDPPPDTYCMLYKPDRENPLQIFRAGNFKIQIGSGEPVTYTPSQFAAIKDMCF